MSIRQDYFANKNYSLIYLHKFLYTFSASIIKLYVGAYLLHLGLPIYMVLVYFAAVAGLVGFFCPYGNYILNKFGIARAVFLSNITYTLFFISIAFAQSYGIAIFIGAVLQALTQSVYTPLSDVMGAIYIDHNENRGKQLTLTTSITALSKAGGIVLGAILLANSSYILLATVAGMVVMISVVPLFFLESNYKPLKLDSAQIYEYLKSPEFRPLVPIFIGHQIATTVQNIFIPLFIFVMVGSRFDVLGTIIASAVLIEFTVTLFFGKYIDNKGGEKAVNKSFIITSIASLAYITLAKTPFSIFLVDSWNKMAWNSFICTLQTTIHIHIREKNRNPLLVGTAWQIVLSYTRAFMALCFAALSYFIGNNFFYVGFILSILGVFIVKKYLHKLEKQT